MSSNPAIFLANCHFRTEESGAILNDLHPAGKTPAKFAQRRMSKQRVARICGRGALAPIVLICSDLGLQCDRPAHFQALSRQSNAWPAASPLPSAPLLQGHPCRSAKLDSPLTIRASGLVLRCRFAPIPTRILCNLISLPAPGARSKPRPVEKLWSCCARKSRAGARIRRLLFCCTYACQSGASRLASNSETGLLSRWGNNAG